MLKHEDPWTLCFFDKIFLRLGVLHKLDLLGPCFYRYLGRIIVKVIVTRLSR